VNEDEWISPTRRPPPPAFSPIRHHWLSMCAFPQPKPETSAKYEINFHCALTWPFELDQNDPLEFPQTQLPSANRHTE